jgi:hypothetical protein
MPSLSWWRVYSIQGSPLWSILPFTPSQQLNYARGIILHQCSKLITVNVTISWHSLRRYVNMPQVFQVPPQINILDLICQMDKLYFENRKTSSRSHALDFMDRKIKSALQMLWNPETRQFYDDVGVECRTPPPESEATPVEKDWRTPIKDNSWIVLMPSAQC